MIYKRCLERGYILGIRDTIIKNGKKIVLEFKKLNKHTKTVIKWGFRIFLFLLFIGTFLVLYNKLTLNFNSYMDLIAMSIIKSGFTILAEIIIGGLFIDYAFNK